MPHQCTDCGRTFSDGSKEMLSGCPDCSGNTFQFHPDDALQQAGDPVDDDDIVVADEEPPAPPVDSPVARTVGKAATTVRDFVGTDARTDERPQIGAPESGAPDTPEGTAGASASEDTAQAAARSDLVASGDLPGLDGDSEDATAGAGVEDGANGNDEPAERPGLADLRAELNDQFESIKVLQPGQYELNLMELYDREEYIIALQEDGRYSIQVPEGYGEPED